MAEPSHPISRSPESIVSALALSLDRYRPLLRLHVGQLQLGRLFRARFDSSDVVQEALVRAVKGHDGRHGTDDAQLVRWLQTVVQNTLVDLVREHGAARRDPHLEQTICGAAGDGDTPLGAYLAAAQPGPSTLAARQEELLQLAAAVDQLPDAERDAVIAHFILELPLAEVAARLNRTVKGVAGLLYRGKERLRVLLTSAGTQP
jgi:RNA polymerase sigma-70 factor (ECF subfamily)